MQLDLLRRPEDVAVDETVRAAIAEGAMFAFSLSGGKDSTATSHAALMLLDSLKHPRSQRIAIHADLGRAEWQSTPAVVERCAERLNLPLHVVRRTAGDLVARWEVRFSNALERYEALSTYNLIGPWSQANKRFCTSELKAQVIGPYLSQSFRGQTIVQVVGIRREESTGRRSTPISKPDDRFAPKDNRHGTRMLLWHPGVDWSTEAVFECHKREALPLHEAYTVYGSTRLSCAFCVLASLNDLAAASRAAGNADLYRHLVSMELTSTFSFQPERWLADVAPTVLTNDQRALLGAAKADAEERRRIEAEMPADLRYVKGWPPRMPTKDEADAIAAAREPILARHSLVNRFPTGHHVLERFAELMELKDRKNGKSNYGADSRRGVKL